MEKTKSLMELLLIEAKGVDSTLGKESLTFRVLMEQERFRQDCRKRAVDLAAAEYAEWYRAKNSPRSLAPTNVPDESPNIIELADKYFNWLISIPDSK